MRDNEPVVIAYPTIMDGLVLRWYRTEADAVGGDEFMSVSRNGISIYCSPLDIQTQAKINAGEALKLLELGRRDEAERYATHRPTRFMGREIEAIPGRAVLDAPAVAYDPEDPHALKDGA